MLRSARFIRFYLPLIIALTVFAAAFSGCEDSANKYPLNAVTRQNLIIYAASSLTDVVKTISANFEAQNPGLKIDISTGSSSQLAKQIERGAPADIFLSANKAWMNYLSTNGHIVSKTMFEPLSNRLVVITNLKSKVDIKTVKDLTNDGLQRIAIADYKSVPAGVYTRQAFNNLGIWKDVQPKLVIGNDVRIAMAYVERDEVDCGIVYATDAKISSRVKTLFAFPESSQPDIAYSFGMVKNTANTSQTIAFLEYLKTAYAKKVFTVYGFVWKGE